MDIRMLHIESYVINTFNYPTLGHNMAHPECTYKRISLYLLCWTSVWRCDLQVSKMCVWMVFRIAVLVYNTPVATAFTYNCDDCGLSSIPTHIPTETTELWLQGNQIRSIKKNSLMTLPNITLLVLSRNMVTYVEVDTFAGLKISNLVMSYNMLTSVPHIEPLASSLWSLDLRKNHITTVEPYTFSNFTALNRLYLLYNSITSLPGFALNMPRAWLYAVHLEANGLATVDDLAFAGLGVMYLKLDWNKLSEFPCFKDLGMLHYLYLSGNPITTAPVDCGPRWNTIRLLDITRTRLTSVDNITEYGSSLYHIQIDGTPVTFSNETFEGTRFSVIIMRDVSMLPQFHSSKLTLRHLELGGIALSCIEGRWLDGLDNLLYFRLAHTSVELLPSPECSNNTNENRTLLNYFHSLHTMEIYNSPLIQFPSLTSYGYNASLYKLYIRKSKISSVPCFPENFKLYKLFIIDLADNLIKHICSLNFAPNVKYVWLSHNPLLDTLFRAPTDLPLLNLYHIEIESIIMGSLNDAVLRVIQNCGVLKSGSNEMYHFPNIKLIAKSVIYIEFHTNRIPNVPCAALGKMEKLEYINLDINVINYVCPMLLTWAPKLATLILNRNQLLEIHDLRGPTRMQLTRVWFHSNPLRCLTSMCWMLFVPQESNLLLGLQNSQCLDGDGIGRNMIAGLTTECTCKLICTSIASNGNIFRVVGHLCREFTGPRWIPHTQRPVTRTLGVYFDLRPNKRLSKQSWGWWFETPSRPLWSQRNELTCFTL